MALNCFNFHNESTACLMAYKDEEGLLILKDMFLTMQLPFCYRLHFQSVDDSGCDFKTRCSCRCDLDLALQLHIPAEGVFLRLLLDRSSNPLPHIHWVCEIIQSVSWLLVSRTRRCFAWDRAAPHMHAIVSIHRFHVCWRVSIVGLVVRTPRLLDLVHPQPGICLLSQTR